MNEECPAAVDTTTKKSPLWSVCAQLGSIGRRKWLSRKIQSTPNPPYGFLFRISDRREMQRILCFLMPVLALGS